MTSSQVVLFAVLCIPVVLFSYLFFSFPRVNRWLRRNENLSSVLWLTVISSFFYGITFWGMDRIALFFEGTRLFASWQQLIFPFLVITGLVLWALYIATGGLVIKAPTFYAERVLLFNGTESLLVKEIERTIAKNGGEIILEVSEESIIIAQMTLPDRIVIEFSWQSIWRSTVFVQMVCYSASRMDFIEKKMLARVLQEFR